MSSSNRKACKPEPAPCCSFSPNDHLVTPRAPPDRTRTQRLTAQDHPVLCCKPPQWRASRAIHTLNRAIFHQHLLAPDWIRGSLSYNSYETGICCRDWLHLCAESTTITAQENHGLLILKHHQRRTLVVMSCPSGACLDRPIKSCCKEDRDDHSEDD